MKVIRWFFQTSLLVCQDPLNCAVLGHCLPLISNCLGLMKREIIFQRKPSLQPIIKFSGRNYINDSKEKKRHSRICLRTYMKYAFLSNLHVHNFVRTWAVLTNKKLDDVRSVCLIKEMRLYERGSDHAPFLFDLKLLLS